MPYFTLNYLAPALEDASPYFTVTEERTRLTTRHLQSLHNLIHYILSNHLICMSVPPSFPLNPSYHLNTISILKEALFPILTALRTTPLPSENENTLKALEHTFSLGLNQLDLTEFEQPLPIVTQDRSSSSLFETPSTSLETSVENLNTPKSYNLPFIEISPDGRRFTLIPYPITGPLDYLEYLHQGIEYVLENRIFISDSSTTAVTSISALAHHSLLSLRQLLLDQSINTCLVMNATDKENITQKNLYWIHRLTSELKLTGFNDNSLSAMLEPSSHRECISNPKPIVNKTLAIKRKKTTLNKVTLIPLFSIVRGASAKHQLSLKEKIFYTCKYSVRKINTASATRYLDIKKSIYKTCNFFKKIYSFQNDHHTLFNYIDPKSKIITLFNSQEALSLLFEGFSENFSFFSENLENVFKDTKKNPIKSLTSECMQIAQKLSSTPIPQINPHILKDILDQELATISNPIMTPKKKTLILPIFAIRICSFGHQTSKTKRITCYLTQYTLLKTSGKTNDTCTIGRISIKNTEKHLEHLCSKKYQNSSLLKYKNPVSKETTIISLNELLPLVLNGIQENLHFLPLHTPSIFKHTKLYQPSESLNNCIKLIKNKLGLDALKENETKTPYILKNLFDNAISKLEPELQTDDKSDED
ncbi:hypothetical protein CLAVI_000996 [Candidatus Clavichlamydia salmonicola]|uniref:hypothetical protein n=1 Tax=Candidatus Clavichlamydia salmonicola TaxID=469812 RepID=UPI001890C563|nr:hypothetical protein [Candidatus Clavichlamydia salmonicola]MBF5051353.1 hypothetical protein [Candidatus Clavichlamydia salmonicola]